MNEKILLGRSVSSNNKETALILELLGRLIVNGIAQRGQGHCISMSNMLHTLLNQNSIDCKLVECQALITLTKNQQMFFVGYDGPSDQKTIDSHVVVVTNTKEPLLIDISVGHRLPNGFQIVVDKVTYDSSDVMLCNVIHESVTITYEQKQKYNIPFLHQISIVDRMATDTKIFRQIQFLRILNYIGISLSIFSVINTILNFVMLSNV